MKQHNPDGIAGPFATYSHGIELDGSHRFLFGAGQTGVAPDGTAGNGIEEQAQLVWQNIQMVLADADMDISDIVQLNMLQLDMTELEKQTGKKLVNRNFVDSALDTIKGIANKPADAAAEFIQTAKQLLVIVGVVAAFVVVLRYVK